MEIKLHTNRPETDLIVGPCPGNRIGLRVNENGKRTSYVEVDADKLVASVKASHSVIKAK